MKIVNCGCGCRFVVAEEWINIDFNSLEEGVIRHNILKGLPFLNEDVDGIFSSCMLEHFSREQAKAHIEECYRCLKKGGIIRIVVPDLENVCREYLRVLDAVRESKDDKILQGQYEYIIIELLDQMTRTVSGGEMLKYWNSQDKDELYILKRTGYSEPRNHKFSLVGQMIRAKNWLFRKLFSWTSIYKNIQFIKFMKSGEIHKWMYDEYSLTRLLEDCGFVNVRKMKPNESEIEKWAEYSLEVNGENEYKPNSLYIEGVKK